MVVVVVESFYTFGGAAAPQRDHPGNCPPLLRHRFLPHRSVFACTAVASTLSTSGRAGGLKINAYMLVGGRSYENKYRSDRDGGGGAQ